jgi:hypothetical protein
MVAVLLTNYLFPAALLAIAEQCVRSNEITVECVLRAFNNDATVFANGHRQIGPLGILWEVQRLCRDPALFSVC